MVSQDADHARRLADHALSQPPPALPWAAARIELDCAHALRILGDHQQAIAALKRAEKRLTSGELSLVALEAARLGRAMRLSDDYTARAQDLSRALLTTMGDSPSFASRWS